MIRGMVVSGRLEAFLTYQSPLELPRESALLEFLSRPEFWPAAAEAKLDGKFGPGMVDVNVDLNLTSCGRDSRVRDRRSRMQMECSGMKTDD